MELSLEKIQKNGYLNFNLKDYNLDLYNELDSIYDKNIFKSYIDACRINLTLQNITDDELNYIFKKNFFGPNGINIIKDDNKLQLHINALSEIDDTNNLINDLKPFILNGDQTWKFGVLPKNNNYLNKISSKIFEKIILELYGGKYKINVEQFKNCELTLYTEGDFITPHEDGLDFGRMCVILLYLNKDYEVDFGGEIIIGNEDYIDPIFGEVVILDFTKNNIIHSVNVIKSKLFERYALINFLYKD
jgi:Rps23 Pro-64 3,4-dihydroxylase Tpa1-like proline 4-hydroxylase